jgi:hypothetical protein
MHSARRPAAARRRPQAAGAGAARPAMREAPLHPGAPAILTQCVRPLKTPALPSRCPLNPLSNDPRAPIRARQRAAPAAPAPLVPSGATPWPRPAAGPQTQNVPLASMPPPTPAQPGPPRAAAAHPPRTRPPRPGPRRALPQTLAPQICGARMQAPRPRGPPPTLQGACHSPRPTGGTHTAPDVYGETIHRCLHGCALGKAAGFGGRRPALFRSGRRQQGAGAGVGSGGAPQRMGPVGLRARGRGQGPAQVGAGGAEGLRCCGGAQTGRRGFRVGGGGGHQSSDRMPGALR